MLSAYYCWRPVYDGYECLQLLEQNGGFGNNGAQPPMQIHNIHNNAGKGLPEQQCNSLCGFGAVFVREVAGFKAFCTVSLFHIFALWMERAKPKPL